MLLVIYIMSDTKKKTTSKKGVARRKKVVNADELFESVIASNLAEWVSEDILAEKEKILSSEVSILQDVFERSVQDAPTGIVIPGLEESDLVKIMSVKSLLSRHRDVKQGKKMHALHLFSLIGDARNKVMNAAKTHSEEMQWEYIFADLNKVYKGNSRDFSSLENALDRTYSGVCTKFINVIASMGPKGLRKEYPIIIEKVPDIIQALKDAIIPYAKAIWDEAAQR